MFTRCLKAHGRGIIQGAALIKNGGLVAFPTETVYGLGANALDEEAVSAIFRVKGRPGDNPLIVHVLDKEQAKALGRWTDTADRLADAFWPGPLSVIVKRTAAVPDAVTAGLDTVALRIPSHPGARALIEACGLPIAAPSANRSGRPSPTTARHVMEDLNGLIPLVLDGGPCEVGLESTVVMATETCPLVLRPGAVTPEMIAMALGECRVSDTVMRQLIEGETAASPGLRHRHYAPKARMTLVSGDEARVSGLIRKLAQSEDMACVFALTPNLRLYEGLRAFDLGRDAQGAAHRLFYLLREMDRLGMKRIFCETLPQDGLGLAVMNRLARAASFDILDA